MHQPEETETCVSRKEREHPRGKLKIFFGYAAGVGKTYAMLLAARQAKDRGLDVVAGCISPDSGPETMALLNGLERLTADGELNLDEALRRRPDLILVDEYARANGPGSRHAKRYQDVQELLAAGIHVYTTVNVQQIESLTDTVASITGFQEKERIPDSAFDQAEQVQLIDIEPEELLQRWNRRKRSKEPAGLEDLTALRELALRRCADRIGLRRQSSRVQSQADYHTEEHILVCLSSSPSNAKIIRTAARMARALSLIHI